MVGLGCRWSVQRVTVAVLCLVALGGTVAVAGGGTGGAPDNLTEDGLEPVEKGGTVVYEFSEDERLDDLGPAGDGVREFEGELLGQPGAQDDRTRVEKPWDGLTRYESIVQLRMSLQDGSTSSCSGTVVGEYHVITAAHCVQFDGSFGGWVDEVSVVPMVDSQNGTEIRPYGAADARLARMYQVWLDEQTSVPEHDFALLTLDRSLGEPAATTQIPWGQYPANDDVYSQDTVYNLGYPGLPPDGGPWPSLWGDDGPGLGHYWLSDKTFHVDADVSGGHSGGPLFHESFLGYEQLGVAAYTTGSSTYGPRITETKNDDLVDWIDSTAFVDPPDDRPEFVFEQLEYTGNDDEWLELPQTAGLLPGEEITIEHTVRNVGTAAGEADVAVREATDGTCERSDPVVASESIETPGAFDTERVSLDVAFPGEFGNTTADICLTLEPDGEEFDDQPAAHNRSTVQTLSFEPVSSPAFDVGDVNRDLGITIVDAALIQQHLAGLEPDPFDPELADVNRDGNVTIVDAALIQQHLAGFVDAGTANVTDLEVGIDTDLAGGTGARSENTTEIAVTVANPGGLGVLQTGELRVAPEADGLGDADAVVATSTVDVTPGGDQQLVMTVPDDAVTEGDWVRFVTDDDESTQQIG